MSATCTLQAVPFNVRDFGAKGDGTTKDTAALQAAVDKCSASGGGRVVLSDGVFLSGAFRLRSGVDLHIDRTARLLASPDIADFPEWTDVKHVKSENLPRGRNACFIFADEAAGIAITGEGTIDCNRHCHVKEKTDPNWTGLRYERKLPPARRWRFRQTFLERAVLRRQAQELLSSRAISRGFPGPSRCRRVRFPFHVSRGAGHSCSTSPRARPSHTHHLRA